jgi:hypothetical protein
MPSLPESYLLQLIENISGHWESAQIIRTIENLLKHLIEIWKDFYPDTYLFVALMMVYTSKTARTLASELWIKATSEGTLNHTLLGETLGKLEHNEYAPLKRFTDLVVANMLNISNLHNKGLYALLSSMIEQMNDEPIKGTKKLLEIYLEILSLTGEKIPEEVLNKLKIWNTFKSLRVVLKKILALQHP